MSEPSIKRRGRPALCHDNRRVQAFVQKFGTVSEMVEELPVLEGILTGIVHLQTEGQASTRPLLKRMLFRALHGCETISAERVAVALGQKYSRAAVARYVAHARVTSNALAGFLDRHPAIETEATSCRMSRMELDRAHFEELGKQGLM